MPNNIIQCYPAHELAKAYRRFGSTFPTEALPKDIRISTLRGNNVIKKVGKNQWQITARGMQTLAKRGLI